MQLELFFQRFEGKGFGKIFGQVFRVNLLDPLPGTLIKLDAVLTECKDVKRRIIGQHIQNGFQMESFSNHDKSLKIDGQSIGAEEIVCEKKGEAIALILPEKTVPKQPS